MKKKILLTVGCVILLSSTAIIAQWKVGGNNLTAPGKFGSLNSQPVIFVSDNGAEQGRLTAGGLWGFGTQTPGAKVNINSAVGQTPFSVSVNDVSKLYVDAVGGVRIGGGGIFFNPPPTNGLFVVGNTGIGTTTPEGNLHVFRGSAGTVTANAFAPLVVENSTSAFINILAPSANNRGILFGDNLDAADGGIVYVGSNNSMEFRVNGNHTKMTLAEGPLYTLTIKGSGLASGGMWVNSDLKLKKDINDFNSAMDIIKQLKPKSYFFKKEEYKNLSLPSAKQYGFVAQELEKVLPELVQTSPQEVRTNAIGEPEMEDVKAMNYNELIPILTRALQEQQQQIEELKQTVNQLSVSKGVIENTSSAKTTNIVAGSALEQNVPNPFTNTTTIHYKILPGTNAQIIVHDAAGKQVKTMQAPENGQVQLTANDLKSGTYTYTLIVNGNEIASKKFILIR
jgi:hypothetical protein